MKTLFDKPAVERDPRDSWPSVTKILQMGGLSSWPDVSLPLLRRGLECGLTEAQLRYIVQGVEPAVLDHAAERGHLTHQAIADIENGMTERWWLDLEITPYVEAYLKFKTDLGYEAVSVETRVYNNAYCYHGTYDSLGKIGSFEVLADFKTTVRVQPEVRFQLAGYDLCLDPNPKRVRYAVQLRPDGTYLLHEFGDRNDAKIFLAALAVAQTKGNF